MPTRSYKPEQIVAVLRQIEVQMGNGKTAPQACKEAGIHTQTYYRWRKEYGLNSHSEPKWQSARLHRWKSHPAFGRRASWFAATRGWRCAYERRSNNRPGSAA